MSVRTFQDLIPPLSYKSHKGCHGKIAIVGGCARYAGAPYFAGISALRMGADLVSVYCAPEAAIPIKCYSPELMVQGIIDMNIPLNFLRDGGHCLIIGPGLGRDPALEEQLEYLFAHSIPNKLVVLDGDGLWFLSQKPNLLQSSKFKIILTPNAMEFKRLWDAVASQPLDTLSTVANKECVQQTQWLSQQYGAVVVRKGPVDIVGKGYVCETKASPRRCGGQGDVLAGIVGLFGTWVLQGISENEQEWERLAMEAAWEACNIVRATSYLTFEQKGRHMLTSDIISNLRYFEEE